jgi:hypothetical protein|tara:strand:- start:1256 stop:1489 length:234 start_codon:yes stop_codon:yes gene_type:complete
MLALTLGVLMNNNLILSAIVPIASLLMIAAFAIPFGYILYQVHHHTSLGSMGVILIGIALLIGTPTVAFLLERSTEN